MKKETYYKIRKKNIISKDKLLQLHNDFMPEFCEDTIKNIWYKHGYKNESLRTTDGKKVIVLNAGEYNPVDGPDFVNAKIIVDGKELNGKVEVHLKRSDWIKHKHIDNPKYKDTIMHVFFEDDIDKINYNIDELCLKDKIDDKFIEELDIVNNKYVHRKNNLCGKSLFHKDYNYLEEILIASAEVRLNIKSEQFALWFYDKLREEQLLYERIAEVYGYMKNRENFMLLARLLPLKKIRKFVKQYSVGEQKKVIETIFFGVSGFLDGEKFNSENDYWLRLKDNWEKSLKKYFKKTVDKTKWNYYKTMPTSYPERKIYALSKFVSQFVNIHINQHLLNTILLHNESEVLKHYINIFYQPAEDFFANKASFDSKDFGIKMPLFSKEKTYVMLINVIFPYLIYKSKSDDTKKIYDKVMKIYKSINYCEKNKIVKDFISKLIIYPEYRKYFESKLMFSQGIIQLYKDFCYPNKGECKYCKLPEVFKYKPNDSTDNFEFIRL